MLKDKLLNDMINSDYNFMLCNKIGIHTLGAYSRLSRERVSSLFIHVKKYIGNRANHSENPSYYQYLFTKYFDGVDITSHSLSWFTDYIEIEKGVSVKISIHDEIAHIYIIFNPALVVAANSKNFVADEYDYTQITPHNFSGWNKFRKLSDDILTRWGIPEYKLDDVSIIRADCCANIELGNEIFIPELLHYLKMVNKRSGCKVYLFKRPEHNAYHLLAGTKNQKLSIYDKCEEQMSKFGRFSRRNILRIEAQFEGSRITQEFAKYTDLSLRKQHRGSSIADIASAIADYAPLVIYDVIDSMFPDGDFYKREFGEFILSESNLNKNTVNRCISLIDNVSQYTNYSDVSKAFEQFRKNTSDNTYYRTLHSLESVGIAPYWLDQSCQFPTMPSLKHIYLSAIRNDSREAAYVLNLLDDIERFNR